MYIKGELEIDELASHDSQSSGKCGTHLPAFKSCPGSHKHRDSMANEDDILIASGGFTMDASQNSLAEQVSHIVATGDLGEQELQCSDQDNEVQSVIHRSNSMDGLVLCGGNDGEETAVRLAGPHGMTTVNDTEPARNGTVPAVPGMVSSGLQVHAAPFPPPAAPPDSTHLIQGPSMVGSQHQQKPFCTIDENKPTTNADLAGGGTSSFSQRMGSEGGSHASNLGARGASVSFGNLQIESHNQPERDFSTELLLRDAMYPASQQAGFPPLKVPDLSMDHSSLSYGPVQAATEVPWPGSLQHPAFAGQMGANMAGHLGSYTGQTHDGAGQFAVPGSISDPNIERADHSGSTADLSAIGGGSSFFEQAYLHGDPRQDAHRTWPPGSLPSVPAMDVSSMHAAHIGAPLSPRHLQTGPAWDQMPGLWRQGHEHQSMIYEGVGGSSMPAGIAYASSAAPDGADMHAGSFSRDPTSLNVNLYSGGNMWMRGESHPQLSSLSRGTQGYGNTMSIGSMPKGGGGSIGGELWKNRTASSVSLTQLQRVGASPASGAHATNGSGSGSSGSRAPSEHPLGEYPSRTLFVRNINIHTTDEELLTIFSQCGEVRSMYTSCKHRGFVMISYYDIRASTRAKQVLQGFMLRQRAVDIHYSVPKENAAEPDLNQGTLVVFNMDSSISRGQILDLFSQFGEVKEIRATPKKEGHKFVEFFDSRHAHSALQGLNRVIVAGRQLKIELSRPGGVRRARNSQQNLAALHSENSSSHNDLLAASSLGSGPAADPMPLHAHSLPSSVQGGMARMASSIGAGLSNGSNAVGGTLHTSGSTSSFQGSADLQNMFQNLMLQAAQPASATGHGNQSHLASLPLGPMINEGFQPRMDNPKNEASLTDIAPLMQHPASLGNVIGAVTIPGKDVNGEVPVHSSGHSNSQSVSNSPANDDGFDIVRKAWGAGNGAGSMPMGRVPVPALMSSSLGPGSTGAGGLNSARSEHMAQNAGAAQGCGFSHRSAVPQNQQVHHQELPPSDSATSLHSFYNALLRQFASNPSAAPTSPESMEGSYQSMITELLQGSSSQPPFQASVAPKVVEQPTSHTVNAMRTPFPQASAPPFHPGTTPVSEGYSVTQGAGVPSSSTGTLPATLAAAAASAAAALAQDPSIPPEEHEARLHQHLMEQLSNMHRHAMGQNMMDQYKHGTPHASPQQRHCISPPYSSSAAAAPPPLPPTSVAGSSPHSSLPHSPRIPTAPRAPHPLSMSHFTPSPPAPPSVDSDLNSPGRGGSCGSSSLRPMSPGGHRDSRFGSSTPRPISARHSRSPLAGGSNPNSLAASVAGSFNSVGEFIEHGSGNRRASHSGEHFILAPDAVGTGPGRDSRTTLMIRNIPNKYTQKVLMQTIDHAGFFGKYDFFYLPIDFKNRCNVGYAFINMATTEAVSEFYNHFHNKGWERFNSEKRCCVAYARIQTRRALVAHFQNSSLMHEDKRCRPVLLNLSGTSPEVEEFPPPRRASHSSYSRRTGGSVPRSSIGCRRDSIDSCGTVSHRGSDMHGGSQGAVGGSGLKSESTTPRLSQEYKLGSCRNTS